MCYNLRKEIIMKKGIIYDFDQMITPATFKLFSGKDLKWEFQDAEDAENAPDRFLCDAQQFLVNYIKQPGYDNDDFNDLINSETELNETDRTKLSTDELKVLDFQLYRIKMFKRAIFHQANYNLINGKKYLSDGFMRSNNTIVDFSSILLAPQANLDLSDGAFLNIKRDSSNHRDRVYGSNL